MKNQQKSTKSNGLGPTGLTPMQNKAITLLLAAKSVTEAAKELNIDRSTLYKWKSEGLFKSEFERQKLEVQEITRNSLLGLHNEAVQTIRECLKSKSDAIRLRAASQVIDLIQNTPKGDCTLQEVLWESYCKRSEVTDLNIAAAFGVYREWNKVAIACGFTAIELQEHIMLNTAILKFLRENGFLD